MEKHFLAFNEESFELLLKIEQHLLDLDTYPDNAESFSSLLRILHTLKGTSAMFGFNEISDLVHKLESILFFLQNNGKRLDKATISIFISSVDLIKKAILDGNGKFFESCDPILISIEKIYADIGCNCSSDEKNINSLGQKADESEPFTTWLIKFKPGQDFFLSGNTPDKILSELSLLGDVKTDCEVSSLPELDDLTPEKSYLEWKLELSSSAHLNEIKDVFIFVEDLAEIEIFKLSSDLNSFVEPIKPPDGDHNDCPVPSLVDAIQSCQGSNCIDMVADSINQASQNQFELVEEKTDRMVTLLGDLVSIQGKLSKRASLLEDPELVTISAELENLSNELRDCTVHLSMSPIGSIFNEMRSLLELYGGESIELNLLGGQIELDRSALASIREPFLEFFSLLVDYLVNLDQKPGKKLEFSACHIIGRVHLGICASSPSGGIHEFFENGNQPKNTHALKRSFENLHRKLQSVQGTVKLEFGEEKQLLVKITIPLNLAIIDSLMVKVDSGSYLLPLSEIEECVELTIEDQKKSFRKNVAVVRDKFIPYMHLREKFYIPGDPPPVQQIVIAQLETQKIGLVVDQVVGEYQTAIKSWGRFCNNVVGINGAAILGDGEIALLVDLPALVKEEKISLEISQKRGRNEH